MCERLFSNGSMNWKNYFGEEPFNFESIFRFFVSMAIPREVIYPIRRFCEAIISFCFLGSCSFSILEDRDFIRVAIRMTAPRIQIGKPLLSVRRANSRNDFTEPSMRFPKTNSSFSQWLRLVQGSSFFSGILKPSPELFGRDQ